MASIRSIIWGFADAQPAPPLSVHVAELGTADFLVPCVRLELSLAGGMTVTLMVLAYPRLCSWPPFESVEPRLVGHPRLKSIKWVPPNSSTAELLPGSG